MASFFLRQREAVRGPIPFAELVELVRCGDVTANDVVRESHESGWQYAAEVIGLFHMADRLQALRDFEEEQRSLKEVDNANSRATPTVNETSTLDLSEMLLSADTVSDDEEVPTWLLRLRQMEQERVHRQSDVAEDSEETELSEIRAAKAVAVQDAVAAVGAEFVPRRSHWLMTMLVIVGLIVATTVWLMARRGVPSHAAIFARFVSIRDQLQNDSLGSHPQPVESEFRAESLMFVQSITPALEAGAVSDDPSSLSLLWIARDYLPVLLSDTASRQQRDVILAKTTQHLVIVQESLVESAKAESGFSDGLVNLLTYVLGTIDMALVAGIVVFVWRKFSR